MKKFLKWVGISLLILTVFAIISAFLGKDEALNLNIEAVDLSQVPDGTYIGSYENFRWSNQVEVTVSGQKIISIKPLKIQDGRDDLVKELTDKILHRQSPDVDAVSGATASSNSFLKAVEDALKNAGNK